MSFEESSALLHELAGVKVSVKQVERAAAEIATDERRHVEKMGDVTSTMYLGMDGTGVPSMRAPLWKMYSAHLVASEWVVP